MYIKVGWRFPPGRHLLHFVDYVIIDSGATRHMFTDKGWFSNLIDLEEPIVMSSANGPVKITKYGTAACFPNGKYNGTLCFAESIMALYVLDIGTLFLPN